MKIAVLITGQMRDTHVNYLNHKEKMPKILHQIKFSKSLKLIDPYYKLKNKDKLE